MAAGLRHLQARPTEQRFYHPAPWRPPRNVRHEELSCADFEIPYVRHGDSLLVPADTSSAGWGDGLFLGGEEPGAAQQVGAVVGSDVRLNLVLGAIPSSTGFSGSVSRLLFTPAR